jgi:hypothetical protein
MRCDALFSIRNLCAGLATLSLGMLAAQPAFAQTNPGAQALPYGFTTQTGGTLPAGMAVHAFAALPTTRLLTPGASDMAYNSTANAGGWRDQGADGIGILGSSNANARAGALVLAVNTTGLSNIRATWTARTVLQQTARDNSIALQWRIGTTGDFTDVAATEYTSAGNALGHSQAFTNIALPAACENKPVVQLRWMYWESAGSSGSRDRLAIDEVSITGTAAGDSTPPTVTDVNVVDGTHVDVTFSEPLGTGATTAANYALSGAGKGTLTTQPNSVALQSGTRYRLTWTAGEMFDGGDITITVTNVQDVAGNAIAAGNSGTDADAAVGVAPLLGATLTNPTSRTLEISFSEAMDTSVLTAANYAISGITPGSVTPNPDSVQLVAGNTYRLVWTAGEFIDGESGTVTVTSVADLAGNLIDSGNNAASGLVPVIVSAFGID